MNVNVCAHVRACFKSPVTSLVIDELVSAVLQELQDPLVLGVDALPRWVPGGVEVRQIPAFNTHKHTQRYNGTKSEQKT